jgi:uncharacterized protein (TIGR03083 family)
MTTAMTDVREIAPIARPETEALAAAETARMVAALRALDPADWSRQTDCPAWDVRAMAGHVLGMTEDFTGLRRMVSRFRAGAKRAGDGPLVDGVTALQVEENAHLGTDELVERMAAAGPAQARWRAGRRLLRAMPDKEKMPDGTVETWRMGYIFDVILTRDTWMHRFDLAHATGRPQELTAAHDGRIVADVVAEWARRHGQPFTLHLTGPAGGSFVGGSGGDELTVDAVEFCRILSGRAAGAGLLTQQVPF